MPVLNGIWTNELKLRPSGLANRADWKGTIWPRPRPKKSPTGALTAGARTPSQYMSRRKERSIFGERSGNVIQMRRTVPLVPVASASTRLSPALMGTVAEPFRPALACAPRPRSPRWFSLDAQRVSTPSGGIS
jgi:hypothetical protein